MRRKHIKTLMLTALMAATLVTGCGGGDSSGGGDGKKTSSGGDDGKGIKEFTAFFAVLG